MPEFEFVEVESAAEVEALGEPPVGHDAVGVWAWVEKGAGVIRERVFARRYRIAEDEATGSAAITLSALIGSELEIRQGAGSRILARHSATGWWRSAGGWSSMGARVSSGDLSDPPVLWSANARASPWGYSLPGVGGVAKVGFAAAF
jgi:hypothetical protein